MRRLPLALGLALFVIVLAMAAGTASAKPQNITDLCQISHPSDTAIAWEYRPFVWGDSPLKFFGAHWREGLRFSRINQRQFKAGSSLKFPLDLEAIADSTPLALDFLISGNTST
ncbi:MAG TPA: hypothetical protein VLA15_04975 [Desulfurivibrionaceae bacterium]|nr:hypothetical protein [Desulfurivibrionaceae bacterium]